MSTLMNDICTTFVMTIRDGDATRLNDRGVIDKLLRDIVTVTECHEISRLSHEFTPQGISMVALLEESHLAAHTWPEHGSAYVTLTTCRPPEVTLSERLKTLLVERFSTDKVAISEMHT